MLYNLNMKLNEIINCSLEIEIKGIRINSKTIEPGFLFVCSSSQTIDRHDYIEDAINNGAVAIITTKDIDFDVPYVKVENIDQTLFDICNKFYNYPLNKLKLIGVTGTDGKTTTCSVIQQLIGKNKMAYIGTLGIFYNDIKIKPENTTPPLDLLFYYFSLFVENNLEFVAMEVSSEAVYHGRVKGLEFDVSILTNLTEDHLNTHKTLENYSLCKQQLFKQTKKDGYCIINIDDKHHQDFINASNGAIITYGQDDSDYQITVNPNGGNFKINNQKINSSLIAVYNQYNLTAAIAVIDKLSLLNPEVIDKCQQLEVDGRMQFVKNDLGIQIVVEYAHTTNSLEKVLSYFNENKTGKIISLFGAAGSRDVSQRPKNGKIIYDHSDIFIVTSDDSRFESFQDISKDLIKNIPGNNYYLIEDRKKAIIKGLELAEAGDTLLVLGKGHESNILKDGKKIPFNDYIFITDYLGTNLDK